MPPLPVRVVPIGVYGAQCKIVHTGGVMWGLCTRFFANPKVKAQRNSVVCGCHFVVHACSTAS
eukprot:1814679-Amphidinium_carterae.1